MQSRLLPTSLLLLGALLAAPGCAKDAPEASAPVAAEAPLQAGGLSGREGAADLWRRLAHYRDTFLASWERDAFDTPKPRAATVLKAFAQVATAVTGPDGFWREQAPHTLLACHANPDDQVCEGLAQAGDDFAEWDRLVGEIARLDDTRADVFLARNFERMATYLDTYVPRDASAESMRQTAFFIERLRRDVAKP